MASKHSIPVIQLEPIKQDLLQSPPSFQPPPPESQEKEPILLKSLDEIFSLSNAINAFKCKFQELTQHLNSINQAIDTKLNSKKKGSRYVPHLKSSRPEIELLCECMNSKGLRKYITSNLPNIAKLKQEVPIALKLAPKPAKLVLECIGRFFLQGIKAYSKDSRMVRAREASVLVLECFLLMLGGKDEGDVVIPVGVKGEAEEDAIAWRRRLISEGGLRKADEVDARGLLLFVACFGIPDCFLIEDLGNLLRLCNVRDVSDALKGSTLLTAKMPEILEGMSKNGMYSEAIEIAAIFGLDDKLSCKTILTLFLEESTKTFKREKQGAQHSHVALKNVNQKQLDALKSILQCLEDHESEAVSLVGEWHIEERIVKLEEEIAELQKKIGNSKVTSKRKLGEMGSSSNIKTRKMKHPCAAVKGSPLLKSSQVNGLHKQWTATLADGTRSYDGLVPNSLDSDIYSHVSNYPAASSLPNGSAVGSFPENGFGSSSMITGMGVHLACSYSGACVDIGVDKAEQMTSTSGLPYGLQSSAAQVATTRLGNLFAPSSSVEGFNCPPELPYSGATDSTAADLYGFVDSMGENESYSNSFHRNDNLSSTYMYLNK